MKILVTGASGKVGSEIARQLMEQKIPVAAGGRQREKVIEVLGNSVEYRQFDAYKEETYSAALEGIDKMFLLGTEGEESVVKWKVIIDEAKKKGVKHILFLSSLGSELIANRPQRLIEIHLQQSETTYTILRPNFFFQNFSTDDAPEIRNGKIFLPCGNGKTSFVDTRDIAKVAVLAILSGDLDNKIINITGSQSLDYFEVSKIFSMALRRNIVYLNPSSEDYAAQSRKEGADEATIKSELWLYDSVKKGKWATVSDEFEKATGSKPILLKQFVEDYKEIWK